MNITIPIGTTATVCIPTSAPDAVTESGRLAADSPGVSFIGKENGKAVFLVQPGEYAFTSPAPTLNSIIQK
jgi:alpha-L-rhamnosidase